MQLRRYCATLSARAGVGTTLIAKPAALCLTKTLAPPNWSVLSCGNAPRALFQRARKLLGCTADGLDPR